MGKGSGSSIESDPLIDKAGDNHPGHEHGHEHGSNEQQHGHGHSYHDADDDQKRDLLYAVLVTLVLTVFQFVFAGVAASLSMLADALHHLVDVLVVLSALVAIFIAERVRTDSMLAWVYTDDDSGLKQHLVELLMALGNCALLVVLSVGIIVRAVSRTGHDPKEENGSIVVIFGLLSTLVNIIKVCLLHRHMVSSLNVRAVYVHAIADIAGSVALLVDGLIIEGGDKQADDFVAEIIAVLVILNVGWVLIPTVQLLRKGHDAGEHAAPENGELKTTEETSGKEAAT